ncbi:MAG: aldehyde ferredoxin oxidoreductase family protein [Deltaproteobacteria bacterium]|nr:aldehyde ferredoxin oxidoreductase family protein [Deltaproteobacteria bacterium]MBW2015490.1 aldehyde ferredoxin oxidoreductase family protein [Deltaproteobacteria bacterium]MBW2128762.1 aldehyde ferredoxin oxidoreductase family protein [Deltaproteobacteria bacterium]MBW2303910.1 aldehyde ferredoxin oxidoreductase family protein [Deltaproteobacteria bacterium]
MLHGYGGYVLRVDLTTGGTKREKTDPAYVMRAIGGRGLNSWRLYDELKRDADPLSEENMLLIGVGPLTGTLLSTSAYTTISGKSPMTGILGDSAAGGFFGPELKQAGYDQIIITGRAEKPCYLFIADDFVEVRDASHLWGKDIWETTSAIRKECSDNAIQVAAIGPAGENLVRYATVACNNSRMFGRSGMGCLFGSKKLKAVAVRGKGRLSVSDPLGFMDLCRELDRRIMDHPEYERRKALGSTLLMKALHGIGILPTNHFQEGLAPYVDQVSGERLAEIYKVKNKACYNCNIHCSRYYITEDGESEGPEFETLCSYSSRIGNDDLRFALKMNAFLNRMGVDSLSSGETIGWAMECVQRGLLGRDDFEGLDFTWGNRETIEKLLHMIVYRQGIGDLFAEGTRHLARHYGKGTEEYAFHVKGLDMICGDPRGLKAFGLTYAIASRGADHLRAEPFFELTERYEESERRFGTRDAADRLSDNGKAVLVEYTERQALLTDCLTMCKNVGLSMDILDFEFAAGLLRTGTGLKFTEGKVNEALRGVIDAERRLNIDFGVDASQDTLPGRFTREPLREGPSKGNVVPIEKMVKEYYRLRGWDDDGVPK